MMTTTITYRGPLEEKVKGMSKAVRGALGDALLLWHQKDLPQHFKTPAAVNARYPDQYQKRGVSYQMEKAKKYGHQNLCEYSGELERNVLRGITITGTSKEVRARLPGSQKANFRRTPNSPNVREDMTAINQSEAFELAQVVDSKVSEFLNTNTTTKTVVI